MLLTGMCEGPRSVHEHHVRRQQHYEDPVGQRDQAAVPLGASLSEGAAERQVEAQPANQAADHLQQRHGPLDRRKTPVRDTWTMGCLPVDTSDVHRQLP